MKWGILGTGSIAGKFADTVNHMRQEGETLVCVGSRKLETARAFADQWGIAEACGSYEDLAANAQAEAVYIATPNSLHYENVRLCLEAGKHVLCEKPFTINEKQAGQLYQLAEEKGLFLMEAFWIRFLPIYEKLLEMIRQGQLGRIQCARSDYGFIAQGARKDRKFNSDLGGGALLDIGVYNIGFMHMITGEEPEFFDSSCHINEYGTDDYSTILMKYPSGCTAAISTSIGMEMPRRAAVFGTKGMVELEDFQKAETMTVKIYGEEEYQVSLPFDINGFEYQIREASKCVAGGHCFSKVWTPNDCVGVMKFMENVRKSWGMKFAFEE
ncbi:MAG TPA: Gfo/Idh/MocA family oxidoreductase [Candidatus Hungatella pullicola]|nr:Gfo/Idh/MocA family oxidoreductase [Candidatus Hungatella pullicola]